MGTSHVPADPERVVALTNEGTEAMLELGVTPVGAVRSWHGSPWYGYLSARMPGVAVLGTEFAVDVQKLAALRPDLIIGNRLRQEEIYDALNEIAPTVMSPVLYGSWRSNLLFYGQTLGRSQRAKAALAAFDDRAIALSNRLGSHLQDRISLVRFMPDETWVYCRDSFGGTILAQVGFRRPVSQDVNEFSFIVQLDEIPKLDGDRLLYFVYETGDRRATRRAEEWTSDSRWTELRAVRSGNATEVSDAVWTTGGGIIAANLLLDDLARLYGLQH